MTGTLQRNLRLGLIAVLCTVLWGSAIPTIKLGYDAFAIQAEATGDKLLFAGIRFLGAGLMILIPYLLLRRGERITKETVSHSVVIGLIQTAAQYFFMYIGLSYTTGVNASVFNSFGTLLYIVLALILFRDKKATKFKILGCAIGFSGILLNSIASQRMGLLSFRGDGLVILSNICVAVGFLYSRHSVKKTNPFLLTGLQMTLGGSLLLVIGLFFGGRLPLVTLRGVLLLVYLMLVSAVAFSLWTFLLREYPPALVGMFNFLTPVFGSLFSYALNLLGFLNDNSTLTLYTVVAIVCAAAGIFLSSVKPREKTRAGSDGA